MKIVSPAIFSNAASGPGMPGTTGLATWQPAVQSPGLHAHDINLCMSNDSICRWCRACGPIPLKLSEPRWLVITILFFNSRRPLQQGKLYIHYKTNSAPIMSCWPANRQLWLNLIKRLATISGISVWYFVEELSFILRSCSVISRNIHIGQCRAHLRTMSYRNRPCFFWKCLSKTQ